MGKPKKDRAKAFHQAIAKNHFNERAVNGIEEHNFNKIVKTGIIKAEQANK